ncbi:unnamed protein product [Trichobilharzia szidati]|nr:unnamed protein product [Trichobilharzia szidati]
MDSHKKLGGSGLRRRYMSDFPQTGRYASEKQQVGRRSIKDRTSGERRENRCDEDSWTRTTTTDNDQHKWEEPERNNLLPTWEASFQLQTDRTDEGIKARIGKARQAFTTLKSVWRSTALSIKNKIRIFNSNVKSVLPYGSETCTKRHKEHLKQTTDLH